MIPELLIYGLGFSVGDVDVTLGSVHPVYHRPAIVIEQPVVHRTTYRSSYHHERTYLDRYNSYSNVSYGYQSPSYSLHERVSQKIEDHHREVRERMEVHHNKIERKLKRKVRKLKKADREMSSDIHDLERRVKKLERRQDKHQRRLNRYSEYHR